jgi:hypothetical protein
VFPAVNTCSGVEVYSSVTTVAQLAVARYKKPELPRSGRGHLWAWACGCALLSSTDAAGGSRSPSNSAGSLPWGIATTCCTIYVQMRARWSITNVAAVWAPALAGLCVVATGVHLLAAMRAQRADHPAEAEPRHPAASSSSEDTHEPPPTATDVQREAKEKEREVRVPTPKGPRHPACWCHTSPNFLSCAASQLVRSIRVHPGIASTTVGGVRACERWRCGRPSREGSARPPPPLELITRTLTFGRSLFWWRAAERRHPTGRENMGSPTLQTLQDPILLLPWLASKHPP